MYLESARESVPAVSHPITTTHRPSMEVDLLEGGTILLLWDLSHLCIHLRDKIFATTHLLQILPVSVHWNWLLYAVTMERPTATHVPLAVNRKFSRVRNG